MKRTSGLLTLIALLVAGCAAPALTPSPVGPPPPPTTLPGPSTTTLSGSVGAVRFEACLRGEGVEIGVIPLDGQGRPRLELALVGIDLSDPENAAALDTCSVHLTTGALGLDGSPLIGEGVREMLIRFSQCVRNSGVSGFPDPFEDFAGVGSPFPVALIPFDHPGLPTAVGRCRTAMSG